MNDLQTELASLGEQAARSVTSAELHGAACGLATADVDLLTVEELVSLLGSDAVTDAGSVEVFIQATQDRLVADDLSFAPLLLLAEPSEFDADAGEQMATALSQWCSAYLAGLTVGMTLLGATPVEAAPEPSAEGGPNAAAGGPAQGVMGVLGNLPPDAMEIVNDFIAIAQLDTEVELDDDSERAMLELEEYIKVGVILLGTLIQGDVEADFHVDR